MRRHTDFSSAVRFVGLRSLRVAVVTLLMGLALPPSASAQVTERLCDNSFENCRDQVLYWINNEPPTGGIDVSFWFMTDWRYKDALIAAWRRGVPVRVLLDLRADVNYPANATIRQNLIDAGIPIRHKFTTGINHWKMMLYQGDPTRPAGDPIRKSRVHFSGANFANGAFSSTIKYTNYVDEAIYFTDDPEVVLSFMTKYDDLWTDTTHFKNLANVGALVRHYPIDPISSDLNFPPDQDYQDRVVARLRQEPTQVDAVMFRITSRKIPDELIKRVQAGVRVRLITDQNQYRTTTYFWHSYNVDRMYMAGVQVKWKDDASGGDMHQKSVVLHGIPTTDGTGMGIFGSSNWTASSSDTQREHNYFTTKPWFIQWFIDQFNRKWNNLKAPVDGGGPITPTMFLDFVPGYPETPVYVSPADQALGVGTSVTLRWEGGWWAHQYDIYFGTTSSPPLLVQNFVPGAATAGVASTKESYTVTGLQPGVVYFWRVVGKTMANGVKADGTTISRTKTGPTYRFTTAGGDPIPPAPTGLAPVAISPTQINLAWTDVAGEAGYKIERKLASSTSWAQIATTAANVTTYQNTSGLTPNTSYHYRVRAWTSGGNSAYSNTAAATTPASSPETGRILADAYVRNGSYAATNFGTATELIVKRSTDPVYAREAYLKLDISAVQSGDTVRLRLSGRLSDTRAANVRTHIYAVASTSWAETSVNWNTRPASGTTVLGTVAVSGTSAQWYDVDLTSHVQAQRAGGATVIAIALKNADETPPYSSFGSRESGNRPQLVISPSTDGAALVTGDTYVRGGSYAATSFGAASELVVKRSADAVYAREAFLKLNISDVQSGDTVRLRLSGRLSDTRAATVRTQLYPVANTSWAETSLTWNTRPGAETTVLGTVVVSGTSAQWYEVDMTSHAQAQRATGATIIAVALKNPDETLPYCSFSSRESGNRPQLLISN